MQSQTERAVLVTTAHRGVFFGFLEKHEEKKVTLTRCRCAIKWNTDGGFLELAKDGPNDGSRIGSEAERVELFDVTSVADVSSSAVAKWLKA